MKKKVSFFLFAVLVMLSFVSPSSAQIATAETDAVPQEGWYFGVEGGVPFGISTFSSFGHDKTHLGWTAGLHGGYKFNPVLSAELTAKYGQMTLSARDCCVERDYWLGIDGVRYDASVLNMDSWNYGDLQSKVSIGQYGARLNVNILGLLNKTRYSRWSVSLSPHIYAVSTKTNIQTAADGADKIKGDMKWHLGFGGDLQAAYQINRHLQLGIYSGLTMLTDSKLDAMPKYLHENNFVWESGLRLGYVFGKTKKKVVKAEPVEIPPVVCPEKPEEPVVVEEQPKPVIVESVEETRALTFPDIYFAFSRKDIAKSEQPKLQNILTTLEANPEVKVRIKGWCDTQGSKATNKRLSENRAKAVADWLIKRGISADRIEAIGMGSDFNEPEAAKARRASTEEQKK